MRRGRTRCHQTLVVCSDEIATLKFSMLMKAYARWNCRSPAFRVTEQAGFLGAAAPKRGLGCPQSLFSFAAAGRTQARGERLENISPPCYSTNMNNGHVGHYHTHNMAKQSLRLAFFLTVVILVAELVGGFLANSLALLSDAGHVVTDLFALGLAWFATVQAERPANARKTFGYHRVGILAALVNALTLIVIAIVITWEAVQRFQHPEPVQPLVMFLSAGIGIT